MNREEKLKHVCVTLPQVLEEYRQSELCSFVSNYHERNEYYEQYIHFAKKNGFVLDEILWKTLKARLYFDIDRSDECERILSEIEHTLSSKSIPSHGPSYFVLGKFYWVKGRLLNKRDFCTNSLLMMEKSLSYYHKEPELCMTDIANVYNSIGMVY